MVDCPAPESRTKGNGPLPSMQTLTDSATWPATVLTVSGTRSSPPGRVVVPAHPTLGARQREGDLRLHVHGRRAGGH